MLVSSDNIKKSVLMLHGFERNSTAEKKFKRLADKLVENNVASLRFDFTGCGISDGEFKHLTVEKMTDDLGRAIAEFKKQTGQTEVSIIGHSLGCCVIATYLQSNPNVFDKIILLAPALNQKDLMRYYFVKSLMKKQNPNLEITWENFREYLNEEEFLKDSTNTDRNTKTNFFSNDYLLENLDKDYTDLLKPYDSKILHIHETGDQAVPLQSIAFEFKNKILIDGKDHDLERPGIFEMWSDKVVNFLV